MKINLNNLKSKATWYFVAVVALLFILNLRKEIVIGANAYIVTLNTLACLIIYAIYKKTRNIDNLHTVVGITFFAIWSVFYLVNIMLSRDVTKSFNEKLIAKSYTPIGSAGRTTPSGIECEYKGRSLYFSATKESKKLYDLYGDSVIRHITVNITLKETMPHVYYIADYQICYLHH